MVTRKHRTVVTIVAMFFAVVNITPISVRAQAPQEGITVHGDWVIDVRQPDGTLVQHHEFQNALITHTSGVGVSTGIDLLSRLLANPTDPVVNGGQWQIVLGGGEVAGPCPTLVNFRIQVIPGSVVDGLLQSGCIANATVTPSAGKLLLEATVAAAQTGAITQVTSMLEGPRRFVFSGTILPTTAVANVVSGQMIQVKVTISFS